MLALDRVGVVVGQRVLQRLAPRGLGAEAGFEQPAGRLARPEAGNPHLAGQLAEGRVERTLELVGRHRYVELDLVLLERFDRGLHMRVRSVTGNSGRARYVSARRFAVVLELPLAAPDASADEALLCVAAHARGVPAEE